MRHQDITSHPSHPNQASHPSHPSGQPHQQHRSFALSCPSVVSFASLLALAFAACEGVPAPDAVSEQRAALSTANGGAASASGSTSASTSTASGTLASGSLADDLDVGSYAETTTAQSTWGQECSCKNTYRSGRTTLVVQCDDISDQCADGDQLDDCVGRSDGPCDLLDHCQCDCTGETTHSFVHDASDGVYLTGIPDLWQFDYMCGADPNAVGCAPIALSTVYYAWAERGYSGLVKHHITSDGLQDWKDLTKQLRSDYTSGVCVPAWAADPGTFVETLGQGGEGEFFVTQDELTKALGAYPGDRGYTHFVTHYRVCDDCNVDGDTDRNTGGGLAVIKNELEHGRPVIIGLDVGSFQGSTATVGGETFFNGDLAVGLGWINHYAVITGYHRNDGHDVIYLNSGLLTQNGDDADPDMAAEWKPGGKWTHLFTLALPDGPDGTGFCPLDSDLASSFTAAGKLDLSHAGKTVAGPHREFTKLAGKACGIARDGANEAFTPKWTVRNDCINLGDYKKVDETSKDLTDDLNNRDVEWMQPL